MSNWRENEIRELLKIRGEEEICKQMDGTIRSGAVYVNIVCKLAVVGVKRTKKQVISKLKTLKARYHVIKDKNNRSGEQKHTWPYYDLCDVIWGHRPCAQPVRVLESIVSPDDEDEAGDDAGDDAVVDQEAFEVNSEATVEEDDPIQEVENAQVVEVLEFVQVDTNVLVQEDDDVDQPAGPVQVEEERPRKKAKKTKLDKSMEAVSTLIADRFEASEKRLIEDERRLAKEQRDWELKVERENRNAQQELFTQVQNTQRDMLQQFTTCMTTMMTTMQNQHVPNQIQHPTPVFYTNQPRVNYNMGPPSHTQGYLYQSSSSPSATSPCSGNTSSSSSADSSQGEFYTL
ncbi:uncharacterized protein [Antedon mediterranea]|uniref:uncharacterized protein n=1 Tax=Antedon mediterranea TaxID=105859 RepID=UPI003AF5837C